jgi:hypothetical protein
LSEDIEVVEGGHPCPKGCGANVFDSRDCIDCRAAEAKKKQDEVE